VKRLAINLKENFSINQIDLLWIIENSNDNALHQKVLVIINILLIMVLVVILNLIFIRINKSIPTSGWLFYFSSFTLGIFFLMITDLTFASFVEPALKEVLFKEKSFEFIRAYILAFRNLLIFDLNKLPGMEIKGLLSIILVSFLFSIQSLHYLQKVPQNILQSLPTWLNIYLLWFFHIFLCLLIGLAVTFFIRLVSHYAIRALLTHARLLPWHYHQFLDWTCDRFILQKIGDSYIFIHPMLREHFAQMDIDEFIQWSDTRKA
jgi:hypothetical protein